MKNKVFSKRFLYGGGSIIIIVFFVAAMVVFNLIAETVVERFPNLRVDLTENKMYELSEETKTILNDVTSDINVYVFSPGGVVPPAIGNSLDGYAALNNHIKINPVDPQKNPALVEKFSTVNKPLASNAVVFVAAGNEDNFVTINSSDLVNYNTNTQTADLYYAESKFTSAVLTVLRDDKTSILFTTGHNEKTSIGYYNMLQNENYSVTTIDLGSEDIPEDTDMLVIVAPSTDFLVSEIEKIDAFLNLGKSMQVYFDITDARLEQLENYLLEWGMSFDQNVIVETDNAKIFNNSPYNLIPTMKAHDITDPLITANVRIFAPLSRSIDLSVLGRAGATAVPLLTTTPKAYAKSVKDTNPERTPEDKAGELNIAVASTKYIENSDNDYERYAKVLAYGTSFILDDALSNYNKDYLMNAVYWGALEKVPVTIRPKRITQGTITMTQDQIYLWLIIILIIIPVGIFAAGIIVWFRRRHL